MRRVGLGLLLTWSGLNLLLALGIVVAIAALGQHPPGLRILLTPERIAALPPDVLGTFDALGILANAVIAGFCGLVVVVVRRGVAAGERWAWWAVAVTTVFVQANGFVSDAFLEHRDLVPNLVSTVLLLTGLGLTRPGPTPS